MSTQTLQNEYLTVVASGSGAELISLQGADGVEYMWQADPAVWSRHAPVLFPIVGALKGGRYQFEGRSYELPQHGFARDSRFDVEDQIGQRMAFRLIASEETRQCYPFEFELRVVYKLDGASLYVRYEVGNAGDTPMPFSIGAHPGFAFSWPEGQSLEDYYLQFDQALTCSRRKLDADKLLSDREEPLLSASAQLNITESLFAEDAIILVSTDIAAVTLRHRKSDRRLRVEFDDFSDLGIWAKPGAPYVCIEPWCGYVDPWDHSGEILDKPGIRVLESGAVFTCEHRIVIEAQ